MRIKIRTCLKQVWNKSECTWIAIQSMNLAVWKPKFASHSWVHAQICLETVLGEFWRGNIFAQLFALDPSMNFTCLQKVCAYCTWLSIPSISYMFLWLMLIGQNAFYAEETGHAGCLWKSECPRIQTTVGMLKTMSEISLMTISVP